MLLTEVREMPETLLEISIKNHKPLREVVFENLREAILKGRLQPGERLMEVQLADKMGVSRTPIREAIGRLELEGLVVTTPRRGTYVADCSPQDIANTFEIRGTLEALAAQLAAQRATPLESVALQETLCQIEAAITAQEMEQVVRLDGKFHSLLYKASHNQQLMQILHNLRGQILRYRAITLATPGRMNFVLEEHRGIAEAIVLRDARLAHQLALNHICNAEKTLLNYINV